MPSRKKYVSAKSVKMAPNFKAMPGHGFFCFTIALDWRNTPVMRQIPASEKASNPMAFNFLSPSTRQALPLE